MMTCIAIDDEPLALSVIEALCSRMPELKLLATFTSTTAAIQYLAENEVDLLFLDVEMPNLNGVDFYRENGADQLVIFITAHRDFAVEGFSVNAIDYLLKPVTFDRFKQAIDKALSYQAHQKSDQPAGADSLYVRSEYALVKIRFNEILYLETMDDYIKIHQLGKKPVLTLMSMKKMIDKLPPERFVRVHRSFVVPVDKIESVKGKMVSLGVTDIPIGASYEKAFFQWYLRSGF